MEATASRLAVEPLLDVEAMRPVTTVVVEEDITEDIWSSMMEWEDVTATSGSVETSS